MTTSKRNQLLVVLAVLVAVLVAAYVYWQFGMKDTKGSVVRRERTAAALQAKKHRQNVRAHIRDSAVHAAPTSSACPVGWKCTKTITKNGECLAYKAPDKVEAWGNACGTAACRGRCYR